MWLRLDLFGSFLLRSGATKADHHPTKASPSPQNAVKCPIMNAI